MHSITKMMDKARELVSQMTLAEKAGLCSGKDFWHTKGIERLSLSSLLVTDGPHGIRKPAEGNHHLAVEHSVPATCFPTAVSTASSFDTSLMAEMGKALAQECLENQVSVVLGPGANIKRNPLCGRNFEYISEDPYLSGKMASAFIRGVQSKNVGVSMKHYLANNQEKLRMCSDSVIDERSLREIYMPAFEMVIKAEQPATLMCSYNKINGIYASDNKEYMTDVARCEWGFEGLIMTDWGAMNDRVLGIEAGLDLEMPSSNGENDKAIVDAVKAGKLDEKLVDICAMRMTALILATQDNVKKEYNKIAHHDLARRIARESAVLLKNDGILPLAKSDRVLIVGEFAKNPRYQGAGSSKLNPTLINSLCAELDTQGITYEYVQGYKAASGTVDSLMIAEAVAKSKEFDKVVCLVGLPDSYESEGFDREHMNMPDSHNRLVEEIVKANVNTIAVLYLGSPVVIPWRNEVKAILNMYLGGQNVGGATYDLLFGDYSPSGKLAETFPLDLHDTPNMKWFAKNEKIVPYMESIYVGYRYYDTAKKEVAYPFGYGLSYTTFEYSNLVVTDKKVCVDVANTGKMTAKEVVQLYVSPPKSKIYKAVKELKGYEKLELQAGEKKTLTFELDNRSFAYWNVLIKDWHVESGEYTIGVGSSSRGIPLSAKLAIKGKDDVQVPDYTLTAPSYYNLPEGEFDIPATEFESVLGRSVPVVRVGKPFNLSNTINDVQCTRIGRNLAKSLTKQVNQNSDAHDAGEEVVKIMDMPLRSLATLSSGTLSLSTLSGVIEIMNGNLFKGIKLLKKGKSSSPK